MASCVAYVHIALVLGFTPIIKQGKICFTYKTSNLQEER